MSDAHEHDHAHPHEEAPRRVFRFEAFADAASAQAAFDAAYPTGSPVEPVLQALVGMGAHCKAVAANRFACRYVESDKALTGFCWQVAIDADGQKAVRRVGIALALLGT
ncbi:MAG TPA: hypothetical protein VGF58_04960 [Burkholderiales bacterium]|jgi:hypothetical protein